MKTTLSFITLLLASSFALAQTTAIPDPSFEQVLIDQGYDSGLPNGTVLTANINVIDVLYVDSLNVYPNNKISDLTGIEDFTNLQYLFCDGNELTSLDVSQNTALLFLRCENNQIDSLDVSQNSLLLDLICHNNQLTSLNMKNGSNTGIWSLMTNNNPNLTCITVDDMVYSNTNWIPNDQMTIDPHTCFSTDCATIPCSTVGINEHSLSNFDVYPNPTSNQLTIDTELKISEVKIVDVTGKTIKTTNQQTNLVDVADLPSGIYFIKVITEEKTITKKFVKQ